MIVPDVNLLLHAYNLESPVHAPARRWLEDLLSGRQPVGLAWVAVLGFIRIATHRQILSHPMPVATACSHVRRWIERPCVTLLQPGPGHADILFDLLVSLGTGGNLTTDAHLAALAIEYQAEIHTTDADFARFAGLRWRNPVAGSRTGK